MSLTDLLSATQATQPTNKMHGIVLGTVADIVDPDGLGRVKVNFAWMSDAGSDAVTITRGQKERRAHSYWARISTLMAGGNRGAYFIPEIGDEVVVAFEHGEIDRPIILGAVWNKESAPPAKMDREGKNNVRAIYSRSGHRIVLNDSDDEPSILIGDKEDKNQIFIDLANHAIEIRSNGDLLLDAKGSITINAGDKIQIKAKGNLGIEASADTAISARGSCRMEATGSLNLESKQKATLKSAGQTEVTAPTVNVDGSALTVIKGGLVKIN